MEFKGFIIGINGESFSILRIFINTSWITLNILANANQLQFKFLKTLTYEAREIKIFIPKKIISWFLLYLSDFSAKYFHL